MVSRLTVSLSEPSPSIPWCLITSLQKARDWPSTAGRSRSKVCQLVCLLGVDSNMCPLCPELCTRVKASRAGQREGHPRERSGTQKWSGNTRLTTPRSLIHLTSCRPAARYSVISRQHKSAQTPSSVQHKAHHQQESSAWTGRPNGPLIVH